MCKYHQFLGNFSVWQTGIFNPITSYKGKQNVLAEMRNLLKLAFLFWLLYNTFITYHTGYRFCYWLDNIKTYW